MSEFYVDPTIYNNRPAVEAGRLEKEIRTYDLLNQLDIPFARVDHAPTATIDDSYLVDQLLGIQMCKNLFLCNSGKTDFYLLLLPGDKKFQTAVVSKQIGVSRLSFAGDEFMEAFLDITPGSVSVLGLMNDKLHRVRLLIDQDVILNQEFIGCHPCTNTSSLRLRTADLLEKFLPFTGHPYVLV